MAALTQNKIRIRLKAYDTSAIEQAAREIVETAARTGATVAGPVSPACLEHDGRVYGLRVGAFESELRRNGPSRGCRVDHHDVGRAVDAREQRGQQSDGARADDGYPSSAHAVA